MDTDLPAARPRLLYLVTSLNAGGAEWGLVSLLQGGAFAGFEVTVVALVRGAGAQAEALTCIGHPPLILWDSRRLSFVALLGAAVRLRRLMRRLKPQVLVLSLPHANLLGRALRPARPRPLVLSFEHNSHLARRLYEIGYRLSSGRVDGLLADCPATAEDAAARLYRRPPLKTEVLPLVSFASERLAEPVRRPPADEPAHLISAARLAAPKNQARLITLLAALRRQGVETRLTLFGEGPLRGALEAQAAKEGVADLVALPGHVEDWWRTPADLFVLTSRHEGLCISVLEAMAAGLPVAAPLVGGLRDYGPSAGVHLLDETEADVDASARRLADLLGDRPRLERMTALGRAMIAERFASAPVHEAYARFNVRLLSAAIRAE